MPELTKNTKVLHLTYDIVPSGISKFLLYQLKNCNLNDKTEYSLVVMNGIVDEQLRDELLSLNCKIHILPKNENSKRMTTLFRLLKIIKNERIDIINTHGHSTKHWAILCKLFVNTLKLVYTVHSVDDFNCLSKIKLFIHRFFIDMNVCISKIVEEVCLAHKINKISLIYNGINIQQNAPREFKHDNIFKIIMVARIDIDKGHDILINALKECSNRGLQFECKFVGGTYNEKERNSKAYLLNQIKELDLESKISFLGPRYDIQELLSKSDLFVLPSRKEGFGLVLLEAMAAQLPVIAGNVGGPAELITHGENGLLFDINDYLDLANQIIELYYNREKTDYLTKNACEYVKKFDVSIMKKKYSDLYGSLV